MSSSPPNKILLETGTNEVEFLLVSLGSQAFGINVGKICQIMVFQPDSLAEMPHQVPEVLGVMSFRGQTISVVDLAINLKRRAPGDPVPATRLLVVTEFNTRRTAFVVDTVDRIDRVGWGDFEPITETSCNGAVASIVGTVRRQDKIVLILDLESILADLDPTMSAAHYVNDIPIAGVERSNVRIVHCEDSPLIQKLVLQVLTTSGFTNVTQFGNGQLALDYMKNLPDNGVEIVLADIEMPIMDGLTFCKNLREDVRYKEIPVIFFSSMINEQMVAKCNAVGGSAAFSKPQIADIVTSIERFVQKQSR